MASYSIGGSPTINEVKTVLGESSTNLKSLFTSSKINKWSLWKPIKHTKVAGITESDIQSAHAGLTLQELKYNNASITGTVGGTSAFKSATLYPAEAVYDRPITSNIARLGDFRWYSHIVPPTDSDYKEGMGAVSPTYDWNVGSATDITTLEGSNSYDWIPKSNQFKSACSNGLVQCLSFRFSTYTGDVIGTADNLSIPLSMYFDYSSSSNRYRIGLLIKVGSARELCVSAKTLKENAGRLGGDVIPTLGTNTYLATLLQSTTATEVEVLPVIVENAQISFATNDGSKYYSRISNWSKLYSMPSGKGTFKLAPKKGTSADDTFTKPSWVPSNWNALCFINSAKTACIASIVASSTQYVTVYRYAVFFSTQTTSTQTISSYFATSNGGTAEYYSVNVAAGATLDGKYGANYNGFNSTYLVDKGYTGWYVRVGSGSYYKVL